MSFRDADQMDFAAESDYLNEQEYNELMAEAPEEFWPSEDDYPDDDDSVLDFDDDGQPDEYTEWQDYYGGDDWDHGQYDFGGEC